MWCIFKILNIYAVTCCPLSHLLNNNVLSVQNRILVTQIFVCVLDWSPSSPAVQPTSSLSSCPCQTLSETTANLEGGESDLQPSPSVTGGCAVLCVCCLVVAISLVWPISALRPLSELSHICIMSWPTWPCLACLHLIYSIFDKIFTICIIQEYHSLNIKDTLHQNRS